MSTQDSPFTIPPPPDIETGSSGVPGVGRKRAASRGQQRQVEDLEFDSVSVASAADSPLPKRGRNRGRAPDEPALDGAGDETDSSKSRAGRGRSRTSGRGRSSTDV